MIIIMILINIISALLGADPVRHAARARALGGQEGPDLVSGLNNTNNTNNTNDTNATTATTNSTTTNNNNINNNYYYYYS